eukprot:1551215-Prymnesium_polylepis.1
MCAVRVSHPPTRGNVPACPDGTPCLPACPVVSGPERNGIATLGRAGVTRVVPHGESDWVCAGGYGRGAMAGRCRHVAVAKRTRRQACLQPRAQKQRRRFTMVQPGKADDWHDEALEDDPGAREYRHLQQRFTTLGFVDGVEAAQEAAMQSGFNDGFQTASAEAVEGGVL